MSDRSINPEIIGKTIENTKGDNVMKNFIVGLIYLEGDNNPGWHWKNEYKKKVEEASKNWSESNEN
jgi:hypothetical protein